MKIPILYGTDYGGLNCEPYHRFKYPLTHEQEDAYMRAIMTGNDLESLPELNGILEDVAITVKPSLIEELLDEEDYYVMECLGKTPMCYSDITDAIEERDTYALKFFGIEHLTDEELDNWEPEELPLACDYEKDFEPKDPFEGRYSIITEFEYPWTIESLDIEDFLIHLFDIGDVETAELVYQAQRDNYPDDLEAFCVKLAYEKNCVSFLIKHTNFIL